MTSVKAIIIDDEPLARQLLNGIISENCPEVTVVDLCQNLPEGVKSIRKNNPDLVFLDIEMPGHSGLELLDFFNDSEVHFSIVFTTAYNQYAIKAFKLSAIDYILKPIDPESIIQVVERFQSNRNKQVDFSVLRENLRNSNANPKLAIHTVSSIRFIELAEICFLKADGAYTHIHIRSGEKILSSKNLKYFEQVLAEQTNFIRCHKSFMVNINEIKEYVKSNGGSLIVYPNQEISVSGDKIQEILEQLKA